MGGGEQGMVKCHLYAPRYFLSANCMLCLIVKVADQGKNQDQFNTDPVLPKPTSEGEAQTLQTVSI